MSFFSFSFPFVFGKSLNSLLTVQTQSLGLFSTKYFHLSVKFQNILQGVYNTLTCHWLSIPMDNETDKTKVMLINLFPENRCANETNSQTAKRRMLKLLHFSKKMSFLEICALTVKVSKLHL